MEISEVRPGIQVFIPSKGGEIGVIKTVPYKIGNSDWLCTLTSGEKVEIKKIKKIN